MAVTNAWTWIGIIVGVFLIILIIEIRLGLQRANENIEEIRSILNEMRQNDSQLPDKTDTKDDSQQPE